VSAGRFRTYTIYRRSLGLHDLKDSASAGLKQRKRRLVSLNHEHALQEFGGLGLATDKEFEIGSRFQKEDTYGYREVGRNHVGRAAGARTIAARPRRLRLTI
jgi:hypothetical protein